MLNLHGYDSRDNKERINEQEIKEKAKSRIN